MDPKAPTKSANARSTAQIDPATLNRINRDTVERQTQAATRQKRQDKPAAPSKR